MSTDTALLRARHLLDLRRPQEAIALLWPLVSSDPSDPGPMALYAQALSDAGAHPQACQAADAAVRAAPEDPEVLVACAEVLRLAGLPREALLLTRRALALAPDSASALTAAALAESAVGNAGPARELSTRLVREYPGAAFAYNTQAVVLRRDGRYGSAERAIRIALELEPAESDYRNNLAALQLSTGRIGAAGHTLAAAIAADPTHVTLRANVPAFVQNALFTLYAAAGLSCVFQLTAVFAPRPVGWVLAAAYLAAVVLGYRWWRGLPKPLRDAVGAYAREKPFERRSIWLALACLALGLVVVASGVLIPIIAVWSGLYGALSLRYWLPALLGRRR